MLCVLTIIYQLNKSFFTKIKIWLHVVADLTPLRTNSRIAGRILPFSATPIMVCIIALRVSVVNVVESLPGTYSVVESLLDASDAE